MPETNISAEQLLSEVFNSNVGLALFDDQLRYLALNPRLASINGLSAQAHLGKTIREVLGEIASRVEPALRRVLTTGEPILNFEIIGALPTRAGNRRWVDNIFPVRDKRGRITHVGVVVVELGPHNHPQQNTSMADSAHARAHNDVLRSWKEISSYAGVCVKTVQRWHQAYNFPVRRLKAGKGAVVLAFKSEIDHWMRTKTANPSSFHPCQQGDG